MRKGAGQRLLTRPKAGYLFFDEIIDCLSMLPRLNQKASGVAAQGNSTNSGESTRELAVTIPNVNQMECPNCMSVDITPIVETSAGKFFGNASVSC